MRLFRASGRRRSRPASIAATVLGTGMAVALLSGCGATAAPTAAPLRPDPSRMLSAADLGAGWAPATWPPSDGRPCGQPPTAAALVGPGGREVHFTGPGGSPAVVEYATLTTSPATTYVHAVERIESGASCSDVAGGQATSSVFDEVIPVPGYGVRSVGMLVSSTDDGVTSQTGYDLVRQAGDVVVVGYTTTGTLDAAALGRVTAEALSTFAH